MYQSTLSYKIKDPDQSYSGTIFTMFFRIWIDDVCNDKEYNISIMFPNVRIDFENSEDAVILKLKGLPNELKDHVEPVY